MSDYIKREDVLYQLNKQATIDGQPRAIRRAARIVAEFPSADVVERKKGKWGDNTKDGGWKCSECGFISYSIGFYERYKTKYRMRFCPNCGSDMRRKADA